MGYFSNGSEGGCYQEEYCDKCYWGDKPCTIWFAHLTHNYDEYNNDKSILDILIPRNEICNDKCTMFIDKDLVAPQPNDNE